MASPSGRAPEQGSRWDLFRTEACGGDKILLEARQMVSVFIGIYGGGIEVKAVPVGPTWTGGAPTPLATPRVHVAAPRGSSRSLPKLPAFLVAQKKSC